MNIRDLKIAIQKYREQVELHPVYPIIQSPEDLGVFMRFHIFAVWDFMSLLKSLQSELTCTTTPWLPSLNPTCAALINRIVVEEESDMDTKGNYSSHFEIYHQAMQSLGFDTKQIDVFLDDLIHGVSWRVSIENLLIPTQVKNFVSFHLNLVENAEVSTIAAVFALTREDLVPLMFQRIIDTHPKLEEQSLEFKYYLERHIELDGGTHSTMAEEMLVELCGEDDNKWERAQEACIQALKLRSKLWDAVLEALPQAQGLVDSNSILRENRFSDSPANV